MTTIEVLKIGSSVSIGAYGQWDIPAEISAICIRSGDIQYECSWWSDRVRYTEWFPADQVSVKNYPMSALPDRKNIQQIGFK